MRTLSLVLVLSMGLITACSTPKSTPKTTTRGTELVHKPKEGRRDRISREDLEIMKFLAHWYGNAEKDHGEERMLTGRVGRNERKVLRSIAKKYNKIADKYSNEALADKRLPHRLYFDVE